MQNPDFPYCRIIIMRQQGVCRRPIKMSLLCQIEMTLPGGFAQLAYALSVLKRARSNNRKRLRGPVHRAAGGRCAMPGLRAHPPPDPDVGDISIWRIHDNRVSVLTALRPRWLQDPRLPDHL